MSTIYRWGIYCQTEGQMVYGYGPDEPTVCYNNNAHAVTLPAHQFEDFSNEKVEIEEVHYEPGQARLENYYKMFTLRFKNGDGDPPDYVLPANSTSMFTWTSPVYPIVIFGVSCTASADHVGDTLNLCVSPDKFAGVLTAPATAGATVLNVLPQTAAAVFTGMEIALDDTGAGGSLERLGEIINVDTANNTVTVDTATSRVFPAGTTNILVTLHTFKDVYISTPGTYDGGKYKIGGTYVPPATEIRISYKNDGNVAKQFGVQIEAGYGSRNL